MARTAAAKPGPHFSGESMKFLRGLARHNDREWFNARKTIYEAELKEPMLAVVGAINNGFADFAPAHVRQSQKAMMRIYRDIRFAREKIPYKTHVAAWWAHDGMEKTSGGGFYLQVSPREVLVAAGCYMPQPAQLLAIRRYLLHNHEELRALLREKRLAELAEPFEALALTRAPKGFPAEHPAIDLLLQRQWGASTRLPAEVALRPGLVPSVLERFRLMAPLVEFINKPLLPALAGGRGGSLSFGL